MVSIGGHADIREKIEMTESEFFIGQIFEETYPPEAAIWCNSHGDRYITELEKGANGKRRFQIVAVPEPTPEEIKAQELAEAKAERAEAVSKIIVEVDDMKFDGDETAQTRMGRTISAAMALGVDLNTEKRTWVLADNTVAKPTIAQLAKALELAGNEQTRLWTVPYQSDSEEDTVK